MQQRISKHKPTEGQLDICEHSSYYVTGYSLKKEIYSGLGCIISEKKYSLEPGTHPCFHVQFKWAPIAIIIVILYLILILNSVTISDNAGKFHLTAQLFETEADFLPGDVDSPQSFRKIDSDSDLYEPKDNIPICLVADNPRTSSIFQSGYLGIRGKGTFEYRLENTLAKCKQMQDNFKSQGKMLPIIKMAFQKDLLLVFQSLEKLGIVNTTAVIVQGDEFCKCPQPLCSQNKQILARQYYSLDYEPTSTMFAGSSVKPPMYLPLGPRYDVTPKLIWKQDSFGRRKYLFNFIGSLTSLERKQLSALLETNSFKKKSFQSFIHITPGWSLKPVNEAEGYVDAETYSDVLLNSEFTLCPMGHNVEAFRFFEAIEALSIPVIAVQTEGYRNHACRNSLFPFIEAQLSSDEPFMVIINTWNDLQDRLTYFREHPDDLLELQTNLQKFRDSYWQKISSRFECLVLKEYSGEYPKQCLSSFEQFDEISTPLFNEKYSLTYLNGDGSPTFPQQNSVHWNIKKDSFGRMPLITGCGRSGTYSIYKFLDSIGIRAIHEGFKKDHISVSWLYGVPDKIYPFEFPIHRKNRLLFSKKLPENVDLFADVYLLVRHPLKVISSTRRCFCGRGMRYTKLGKSADLKSWKFAQKHLNSKFVDESFRLPPNLAVDSIRRSMLYWLNWNKLLLFYHPNAIIMQLENLTPESLLEKTNLKGQNLTIIPNEILSDSFHVSPEKPKLKYQDVTWSDLILLDKNLAKAIFQLAQQFGYEREIKFDQLLQS